MSYLVLARKWRPTTFEDVVGQGHITQTLKNAITRDRVAHALLFTGSRGIGKTSCARILAKALNCEQGPTPEPCGQCTSCTEITAGHSVDVFEIDGASNNSVEQIREIRESVKFLPSQGKRKMYIIDEVHMLSTGAFNALLKTLEEPPEHVIFVLATTEPHKIPETILSRCQRFDFKRIPERAIAEALKRITDAEGVEVDLPALSHIAREAEGGMRDSLSLLDQVISFCGSEITEAQVREVLGIADRGMLHTLVGALIAGDGRGALEIIDDLFQFGIDLQKFTGELLKYIRDLMVVRICEDSARLVDQAQSEIEHMRGLVGEINPARIHRLFNALLKGAEEITRSPFPKLVLEMTVLRICHQGPTLPLADVLKGLERLEARLGDGGDDDGGGSSGAAGGAGGAAGGPQHGGHSGAHAAPAVHAAPAPEPSMISQPSMTSHPGVAVEVADDDPFARVAALVEAGVPAPEPPPDEPAPYRPDPSEPVSAPQSVKGADAAPVPASAPAPAAPVATEGAMGKVPPPSEPSAAFSALPSVIDDTWPDPADSIPWTMPDVELPRADDPAPWPPKTGPLAVLAARKAGWIAPEAPPATTEDDDDDVTDALSALTSAVGLARAPKEPTGPAAPCTLPRPGPDDLPVIPMRPDQHDAPIDWTTDQDPLARLQQLLVRMRKEIGLRRMDFLVVTLEAHGRIRELTPERLTMAVPADECTALTAHHGELAKALDAAAGHPMTFTLLPCQRGDDRLRGETVRVRALRILEERKIARQAHARAHERIIDALEIFGGEITEIIPHGP